MADARKIAINVAIGVFIGVPAALLMLAKLFQSDVLGWMFGFSLMFDVAIAFCAGVVAACIGIWSAVRRRGRGAAVPAGKPATVQPGRPARLLIKVDRDSVAAGDDGESHELMLAVDGAITLAGLLDLLAERRYLPSISGGQATWVVQLAGRDPAPLAVVAQQWSAPRLLVDDQRLTSLTAQDEPAFDFKYRCQLAPEPLYAELASARLATSTRPAAAHPSTSPT